MFLFNCAEHIDQEIEFALNGARRLTSPQRDIIMTPRHPIAHLPTHEVTNMPPHLGDMIIAKLGQAQGEKLIAAVKDSANDVFSLIKKFKLECDAEQVGWLQPLSRRDLARPD